MFVSVKAKVYTDSTGAYTELPALLTRSGPLEPLLDYCISRWHDRSLAWMRKVTRSVQLFLEYLQTNPAERDSYRLFQNFAQRLYTGTFNKETGLDPSGLCWSSRSVKDAAHIIGHLTDFFDWLSATRAAAAKVNPRYAGSAYDRLVDEAAYQYRRDKAFLGHTWAANAHDSGAVGHLTRSQHLPRVEASEPPAFPDEIFEKLLFEGFQVSGRYDLRNMLITLLLHGAGFRESEPFHLYIGDVFPDPSNENRAMVLIHHPVHGYAPSDWHDEQGRSKKGNRRAYLGEKFGLAPRTELLDKRGAGWKGGTHDGAYYKQAYWFCPEYGDLFLRLWKDYLQEVARLDRAHPFAFVNLRREPLGEMYCIAQFNKAHATACERIGLTVAKHLGTTPHGHRHAYGRRLKNAGVDRMYIRRFMHHASPESQNIYTQATTHEAVAALKEAATRLQSTLGAAPALPSLALSAFLSGHQ